MRTIILASGSPRRRDLLTQMGIDFEIIPSDFDEHLDETRSPEIVAMELGLGKAKAVATRYPEAIVIGADTIVHIDGKQLGKCTTDAAEREALQLLSGRESYVTSSVAVVCTALHVESVASDTAAVVFKPYDAAAVETYVRSGDWRDKAVYGTQSGAAPLVDRIEGDYDTVLGLSTRLLVKLLAELGIEVQPVRLTAPVPQVVPLGEAV